MSRILNVRDCLAIAEIVNAAKAGGRVRRLLDGDLLVEGVARSVGDQHGNFLGAGDDVRDSWLRVTTSSGLEAFWPLPDLVDDIHAGLFAVD